MELKEGLEDRRGNQRKGRGQEAKRDRRGNERKAMELPLRKTITENNPGLDLKQKRLKTKLFEQQDPDQDQRGSEV